MRAAWWRFVCFVDVYVKRWDGCTAEEVRLLGKGENQRIEGRIRWQRDKYECAPPPILVENGDEMRQIPQYVVTF